MHGAVPPSPASATSRAPERVNDNCRGLSKPVATTVGSLRRALARARHRHAERHLHEHGPGCGHEAVSHGDHVDYLHDGHRHAAHEGHYDEHAHGPQPPPEDSGRVEHEVTR